MSYRYPKQFAEILIQSDILVSGYEFAKKYHDATGVMRDGEPHLPYISHPVSVTMILNSWGASIEELLAGLLHDVVEDTEATREDLVRRFGEVPALINDGLNNQATKSDGNRKRRVAINIRHSYHADIRAKKVKLADIKHNTSDLHLKDPKRAKSYLAEKWMQIHAVWHETLQMEFDDVAKQIKKYAEQLKVELPDLPKPYLIEIPAK